MPCGLCHQISCENPCRGTRLSESSAKTRQQSVLGDCRWFRLPGDLRSAGHAETNEFGGRFRHGASFAFSDETDGGDPDLGFWRKLDDTSTSCVMLVVEPSKFETTQPSLASSPTKLNRFVPTTAPGWLLRLGSSGLRKLIILPAQAMI